MIDFAEPSLAEAVQLARDVPLPFANVPLGPCPTDACTEGVTRSCASWSDPYGCGGCCWCRGCMKVQWEQHVAPPFVWEGDDT